MSDKFVPIVTALIGVAGSVVVALITTNATFDSKLTTEQQAIIELEKKIEQMNSELSPITLNGNGNAQINGKDVAEIDNADKRFYQQDCKLSTVSHAILNTIDKGNNVKQPALCTCSDHPVGGRGWVCFD